MAEQTLSRALASPAALRPPRLPAGPSSFARAAQDYRRSLYGRFDRLMRAIEPWYDWGTYGIISLRSGAEGDGRFLAVDFLGAHLMIVIGRTPQPRSSEEGAAWAR